MAKLTFTFDTENAEDLKLLKALPLFKSDAVAAPEPEEEQKPSKPKKTAKKQEKKAEAKAAEEEAAEEEAAEEEAAEEEAAEEEAAEEEAAEEEAAEETDISIEEIRELVSEKAKGGHRKAIKAKFKEYDVDNVSTMPKDKYSDFKEFLTSLK